MKARNEPGKGFFRACLKVRYQSRFLGLECKRADKIAHGGVRLQISVLPRYRNIGTIGTFQFSPGTIAGFLLRSLKPSADIAAGNPILPECAGNGNIALLRSECPE